MSHASESLEDFMRAAIAQGKLALPACLPNPPVGCVLVRDGAIIARGFTQPPYQPHAEPMALGQIDGFLDDVTAFVTLEPCAFHQRTPSCAKEMIARRVGTIYVALIDPHPKNRGRGIQMLRDAGIRVVTDFLSDEARAHLEPYLYGALERHSTASGNWPGYDDPARHSVIAHLPQTPRAPGSVAG